mmetsp:Transcript_19019/g.29292  ORF Transcript_19019/g.29292 Transcript_19019/m.29292 type:complete len:231 (+) Transcript_19019:57-749(+)
MGLSNFRLDIVNVRLLSLFIFAASCCSVAAYPANLQKYFGRSRHFLLEQQRRQPYGQLQDHLRTCMASSSNDNNNNGDDEKFSFGQRIESVKCVAVGAISGGIALTPVTALHDIGFGYGGPAQWEFDTDMGSLEAGLFAIVYRYCIRKDDNPMLNQGVIGAFVLARTLSRIQVPSYCTFAPLNCGAPLYYFDWNMIQQAGWNGAESVALFGAAAFAMDYCFKKSFISKFP